MESLKAGGPQPRPLPNPVKFQYKDTGVQLGAALIGPVIGAPRGSLGRRPNRVRCCALGSHLLHLANFIF